MKSKQFANLYCIAKTSDKQLFYIDLFTINTAVKNEAGSVNANQYSQHIGKNPIYWESLGWTKKGIFVSEEQ